MQSRHYEITIRGRLGTGLINAFDGLSATPVAANTVIRISDQAAANDVMARSFSKELSDASPLV